MKNNNLIKIFLFIILILILFLFIRQTNKKSTLDPNLSNPTAPDKPSSIRIATNLQNENIVDTLNKYANADDIIEVRAREVNKLNSIKIGKPLLIYGKNDDQQESFKTAILNNIKIIGYNLEDARISKDELVNKEKEAYEVAKENGLFYVFAPLAIHAEKYGAELGQNADAVVIQLRNYQLMDNFSEKVKEMSENIKMNNKNVEVWVQLDINARIPGEQDARKKLTSDELIKQIEQIDEYVDLISLYYPPSDPDVVIDVITQIR